MKNMTCLLLAGTAALSLAACGSESAPSQTSDGIVTKITKPVELQFWHSISNPVHAEVLDKLIAQFNDTVGKEKQITVTATFNGSSSDLYSNVIAAIKAETAPDVTLALRPYVADYLQTDLVVDLTPYIQDETVGMPDYEDIFEGLRNGGTTYAKEGTYSLPIHSYSEVLYYNTAFFEENGELILVDYKTDYAEQEETLIERYKLQLDYYRRALMQMENKPVKETLIYSFRLGEIKL